MGSPIPTLPPGYTLDNTASQAPETSPALPPGYKLDAAPKDDGSSALGEIGKFVTTAAARGLGGLGDFLADPLYAARSLVSPELAQMERQEGGVAATPGTAAANEFFNATGIPEYKPESTLGRVGLGAAEGGVAGGPFGLVPAALSAAGGAAGQGAADLTGSQRLGTLAALAPGLFAKPVSMARERFASPETQATNLLAS